MHKSIFSFIVVFFVSLSLIAQDTKQDSSQKTSSVKKKEVKISLDKGTIKSQFDYMIKRSNNWQDYEVIKIPVIRKFGANVQDSLSSFRTKLNDSKTLVSEQNSEIAKLKNDMKKLQSELDATVKSKDSMKLIGIELPKGTYNTIMWIIILVSLLFAGICFMLFKRSNSVTVEIKNTLEEVREEFDTHRKNALVREQKLARKLQDEVIKNKNLGL
nr:hypothetical protein [uncultured Marinifilum sp.]